ncbi:hypothetical protein [Natronorubrum bangense]|uniref:hypothetical protein n=1 Tax=Natronorubrum bangense TaxID=61858 RepID=UPI000AC7EB8C
MHEPSPDAPSLAAYADVTDRDRIEQLRALAAALEDTHILHVNSAAAGGGVAELLRSIVPLRVSRGRCVARRWLVNRRPREWDGRSDAGHPLCSPNTVVRRAGV